MIIISIYEDIYILPENESWNIFVPTGDPCINFTRMSSNEDYSTPVASKELAKEICSLIRDELMSGKKNIAVTKKEEITLKSN